MEFAGDQLPRMNWESSDLSEEWRKFRHHADLLFSGPLRTTKEDEKCCYLLIWVGEQGRDIFNTWINMPDHERSRLKAYYSRFDEWVSAKVNPILARSKFYERRQSPGEPLDQFVAELQLLARDCEFMNTEEMIRDRLLCGIYLQEVRQKLINEGRELNLKRALDIARICEMTQGRLEDVYRNSPFLDCKPPWLKRKALQRAAEELGTPAESCDESGSSHETEEGQDFSETEQMEQDSYMKLIQMSFDDVALHFSEGEWEMLLPIQRQLYKDVMQENYKTMLSLGYDIPKPQLLCLLEEGKWPCCGLVERKHLFVPADEDISESFLLSLIADDNFDSDPDGWDDDDRESTDDSVCSMLEDPEPVITNGPVLTQKRSDESTVFVREMIMDGKQWNVTVNCIATKPASQTARKPFEKVNGRASPALLHQALTDLNRQSKWEMINSYAVNHGNEQPAGEARSPTKADSIHKQLKPFNNGTAPVGRFHLGADIPLLLNIKQEKDVDNGLISAQSRPFRPVDIKEETEAIPICNENSQARVDIAPRPSARVDIAPRPSSRVDIAPRPSSRVDIAPRPIAKVRKRSAQRVVESERSYSSDSDSSRRYSSRIIIKLPEMPPGPPVKQAELCVTLEGPDGEKVAPISRKRKSPSVQAKVKKAGPQKRGPKPRNQSVKRPALKSRLPEQQVPLALQKMYRCSKCQRTFSHYSQFIAHQRYESRKKANQRSEPAKRQKIQQSTSPVKRRGTRSGAVALVKTSGEAPTSQRATRSSRLTEGSKDKENDSSKSPQREIQRLRERRSYNCNVCKRTFTSKSSMVVRKGDDDEEVFTCSKCEEADGQATAGATKYECSVCQKTFAHKTGLVAHLRIHTGDKPHKCSECDQTFSYRSALIVHQRSHKKAKAQAKLVVKMPVPAKVSVPVPAKVPVPVPTKVQEKVPDKVQEPKKSIVYIAPKATATGVVRTYQCPQCKEEFVNSTLLFTHQQTHTGPKPHQCQYCEKSFNDKALLGVHQKTHTGESPYQCGQCQKTFTSQSLLVSHGLTHSTGKPFQCKACDKSFNGEALLLSHQRTHTGEKTYQCPQCKETFPAEALLTEHQKVHIEDRPHKCDYCEKGFNSQTLLVAHRRIHTGEKAFHCHYCGEGFNTSSLLNVHLRNHAPEKPYPCDLCERSFNLKSLQQAHRATHETEGN